MQQMNTLASAMRDATAFGLEEVDQLLMPTTAVQTIPKQYTILWCNCMKVRATNVSTESMDFLVWNSANVELRAITNMRQNARIHLVVISSSRNYAFSERMGNRVNAENVQHSSPHKQKNKENTTARWTPKQRHACMHKTNSRTCNQNSRLKAD